MQSSNIESIVFANGLTVGNVSKEQSNRIGLILFGDPKPQTMVHGFTTSETSAPKAKKRGGWRAKIWTSAEEARLVTAMTEGQNRGIKKRVIILQVAKELNRTFAAVNVKYTKLNKVVKYNITPSYQPEREFAVITNYPGVGGSNYGSR